MFNIQWAAQFNIQWAAQFNIQWTAQFNIQWAAQFNIQWAAQYFSFIFITILSEEETRGPKENHQPAPCH